MAQENDTSPRGPWGWVGVWVREEKFWRDIGARVLAGVVTAAIVYAGALLLGYLHSPEIGAGLLLGLGIVACGGLVAGSVTLVRGAQARRRAGGTGGTRVVLAVILLFAAIAIATGVATDVLR